MAYGALAYAFAFTLLPVSMPNRIHESVSVEPPIDNALDALEGRSISPLAQRTAENKQWMADLLRGMVADQGGTVNDEGGLSDLAAWYIGEDRVDSIHQIKRDLEHASWVTYPSSQKSAPAADCIFEGFWKVDTPFDLSYIYEMRKVIDAPRPTWEVTLWQGEEHVSRGQEKNKTLKHDSYGSGFSVTWGPPAKLDNSGWDTCNPSRSDIEPGPVSVVRRHGYSWSVDFYLGLPKGAVVQWGPPSTNETSLCPKANIETLEGELFSTNLPDAGAPIQQCKIISANRIGPEYAKTYR